MILKNRTKSLIQVHIAVFLFGFSALFGKFLNLSPIVIVFGRVTFAAIALGAILILSKKHFKLKPKKDYFYMFFLGFIFAFHWAAFFQSVQVSNIAIAVLTFSTYPLFVTFMEPYFFKEKIRQKDIIIALITFSGIMLVIPSFELKNNFTQGALWGIIAGFTGAMLTIYNKLFVKKYSGMLLAFYECSFAAIILLPFVYCTQFKLGSSDVLLLILLGVIFTALSHVLYITSVSHMKAQLASIITCLEPVYGIIFAVILLNEIPTIRTLTGGLIILGSTIYATLKPKD